jgi:hypothetical protein
MRKYKMLPIDNLESNLADVKALYRIVKSIIGNNNQIFQINKSSIVLITASFEIFIEDLANYWFNHLIKKIQDPNDIPSRIRIGIGTKLLNTKNPKEIWKLAGPGWKAVLLNYKEETLKKETGFFNNPIPDNIDKLFLSLFGIDSITKHWKYKGKSARKTVKDFILTRHKIVHKNANSFPPSIYYSKRYLEIIEKVAKDTNDYLFKYLIKNIQTGNKHRFPN